MTAYSINATSHDPEPAGWADIKPVIRNGHCPEYYELDDYADLCDIKAVQFINAREERQGLTPDQRTNMQEWIDALQQLARDARRRAKEADDKYWQAKVLEQQFDAIELHQMETELRRG